MKMVVLMNLFSVLRLSIHSKEQLQRTLQLNELKVKNAAIYADNASDYAKGLAESLKKRLKQLVGKLSLKKRMLRKIRISVRH